MGEEPPFIVDVLAKLNNTACCNVEKLTRAVCNRGVVAHSDCSVNHTIHQACSV